MTTSPELIRELQASRPTAPTALRARVREIAAQEPKPAAWPSFRLPFRRLALVAAPTAAALALGSAAVIGITSSSDDLARETGVADRPQTGESLANESESRTLAPSLPETIGADATLQAGKAAGAADPVIGAAPDRVQDVNATLTVEVADSDGVSKAAQEALVLTRRLGGHVVSASVATGDNANASLIVEVPVAKVQEAVVGLSALGTIVSQQVTIADLQEQIDALERRQRSLRSQIALVVARLGSGSLDAEARAVLEARLKNLREELRAFRRSEAGTRAEGRMATIQLAVVTPESRGEVVPASRFDRTLDKALDVLAWEGVVALAVAIVAAPFLVVAALAWIARRFYRRREEDRLLAT